MSKSQRMRELYDQGMKIADIARTLQTHYSFVHRVIRRYQAANSQLASTARSCSTSEQIRQLYAQGLTVSEIQAKLNIPRPFVNGVIKRYLASQTKSLN